MTTKKPGFALWESALRDDCQRRDKVAVFDALGDEIHRMFWERRTEPSVRGVLEDSLRDNPRISPSEKGH